MSLWVWPVNDVERVKIADSARYLGRVKPRSGLWETPLSLQVEEQLQKDRKRKTDGWTERQGMERMEGEVKMTLKEESLEEDRIKGWRDRQSDRMGKRTLETQGNTGRDYFPNSNGYTHNMQNKTWILKLNAWLHSSTNAQQSICVWKRVCWLHASKRCLILLDMCKQGITY